MKALTCEMCGSTNLIKDDGIFVCQSCSTKYSVEEAKKMMIDGTVEIAGTVKIDTSSELANLYEIARRAKDTENRENALKYYEMILVKDPNSWEANFYVVYFKAMTCTIANISTTATLLSNNLSSVLGLIKKSIPDKENKDIVIREIFDMTNSAAVMLSAASITHYKNIDSSVKDKFLQDYILNTSTCTHIMYNLGDSIIVEFMDEYSNLATQSWEIGINMQNNAAKSLTSGEGLSVTFSSEKIIEYSNKIKKYNSTYQTPEIEEPSGSFGAVVTGIITVIVIILWLFSDYIFM